MSYQMRNDPRARKAGRFIYRVQKEIQKAFVASGLKQQEIAEKLGVNRSVVNKRLLGEANLTLRTIADLAWAMDADIVFSMKPKSSGLRRNYFDVPRIAAQFEEQVSSSAALAPGYTVARVNFEIEDA